MRALYTNHMQKKKESKGKYNKKLSDELFQHKVLQPLWMSLAGILLISVQLLCLKPLSPCRISAWVQCCWCFTSQETTQYVVRYLVLFLLSNSICRLFCPLRKSIFIYIYTAHTHSVLWSNFIRRQRKKPFMLICENRLRKSIPRIKCCTWSKSNQFLHIITLHEIN